MRHNLCIIHNSISQPYIIYGRLVIFTEENLFNFHISTVQTSVQRRQGAETDVQFIFLFLSSCLWCSFE